MLPEITLKISLSPEGVIISDGQADGMESLIPAPPEATPAIEDVNETVPPTPTAEEEAQTSSETDAAEIPPPDAPDGGTSFSDSELSVPSAAEGEEAIDVDEDNMQVPPVPD